MRIYQRAEGKVGLEYYSLYSNLGQKSIIQEIWLKVNYLQNNADDDIRAGFTERRSEILRSGLAVLVRTAPFSLCILKLSQAYILPAEMNDGPWLYFSMYFSMTLAKFVISKYTICEYNLLLV